MLMPPPAPSHSHEPAGVSEHDFDALCEDDLNSVTGCGIIATAVEDVGCAEEGPLSSVKPPLVLLPPSTEKGADVPVRLVSRRFAGTAEEAAAGPVVDLFRFRLAQQSAPTEPRT